MAGTLEPYTFYHVSPSPSVISDFAVEPFNSASISQLHISPHSSS